MKPKDKLMATISTNDIKIRYDIDLSKLQQATSEFDKITAEERQLLAELGKLKKQFDEVGDKAKKAGKDAGDSLGGIGQAVSKVGPVIAGIFAADKIIGFTKEVIAVTAEFQKLAAVLKNTLGSNSASQGALMMIKEFAATTPFSVQELTASFVKLANQGFTPNVNQLKKLGDLASSTGKSFDQLAEAIIDAQTGEFERLKDFGIRASKEGDKVTFMFKEQKTTVDFTNKSIRDYIVSLGDLQGVSGAAGAIAESLGGQINNLGDSWDSLLNTIGERLAPVFSGALKLTASFLGALNDLFKGDEQKTKEFLGSQYTAYSEFFVKTSDQALKNIVKNSEKELVNLKQNSSKLKAELEKRELELVKMQAKFQDEKGSGFTRQYKIRADAAQKAYDKAVRLETATQAMNQAAIDEINKRAKAAEAASASTEKQDKAAYQARLKVLELEKQQQVLMAQLRGSKLGEVGAERVFQEAVYQLKLEYSTKNIGIIEDEVRVAKLQRDKALKDYNEAAEKEKLITKEAKVKVAEEDKTLYDKRLAQMKQWQKAYEDDLKNQIEKEKEAAEMKEQIKAKALQLGQEITNGAFDLYQRNLSNELTLLQRKYDEEIRLADGNQQKITQLNEKKRQEEKEIKTKQFRAEQLNSIANIWFQAAPQIVKYGANPATIPLAVLVASLAAVQTGFVAAQPVPEFAEGTKGKPFKGGKAIVGERGVEKVVTESGKVYFTPPTATLMDLPKGAHVIPNHALSRQELFLANHYANRGSSNGSPVVGEIRELGSILKSLPITQVSMDEKGFEKFIRTPRRTTKILNNRFRSDSV